MNIEQDCRKYSEEDTSNEADDLKRSYGDDLDDHDGEDFAARTREPEGQQEDVYLFGWKTISKEYRDSIQWKCERCSISLRDRPDLLHVHHITRVKSNCDYDNLEALCAWCHSTNPGHSHIWSGISATNKELISDKRKARGLETGRLQLWKETR